MKNVMFIDPGDTQSAICIVKDGKAWSWKEANDDILLRVRTVDVDMLESIGIEMVACYGMPVGKTVFDTAYWVGRFDQVLRDRAVVPRIVYRKEIKMHLCHNMKAKDGNIAQALRDRFGEKGTKKAPGFFYGFSKDMWQAMAGCAYLMDKAEEPI